MTINDILNADLSDSAKIEMIKIFQKGGIAPKKEKVLEPTETILIGDKEFDVEIARTPEARKDGLSRVKRLPKESGMLFIFPEPVSDYFTMKDTSIPLDIIFMDEEGVVVKVVGARPHDLAPIECSDYQYVLETNPNSGVEIGDEMDQDEDDDPKMLVLDSNGDVQMSLQGGERIFSRISTRRIIKAVLKAYKTDSDSSYRRVAKIVFDELDAQDSREPEYVEGPE